MQRRPFLISAVSSCLVWTPCVQALPPLAEQARRGGVLPLDA